MSSERTVHIDTLHPKGYDIGTVFETLKHPEDCPNTVLRGEPYSRAEYAEFAWPWRYITSAVLADDSVAANAKESWENTGTVIEITDGEILTYENPSFEYDEHGNPLNIKPRTKGSEVVAVHTPDKFHTGVFVFGQDHLDDMGYPTEIFTEEEAEQRNILDQCQRIYVPTESGIYCVVRSRWGVSRPLSIYAVRFPTVRGSYDRVRLPGRYEENYAKHNFPTPQQMTAEEKLRFIHELSSSPEE